ncbi:MAG: cytochrome oxidase assembly protein, partial [Aureliella sp.]
LSIGLVIAAFRYDNRAWFRWWCVGVLLAVIAQGALGGARVVLDQRTFAMIHGCTGPLFFAIATATAVMSSQWWLSPQPSVGATRGVAWIATLLVATSYSQLILGAQLRHVTAAVSHTTFMAFVHTHLTLAGLITLMTLCLVGFAMASRDCESRIRRPSSLLLLVVLVQIGLGIGTWIVNYALPWSETTKTLAAYTIAAKGFWESLIVTAHMATGSLIISLACVVALRAWRTVPARRASQ